MSTAVRIRLRLILAALLLVGCSDDEVSSDEFELGLAILLDGGFDEPTVNYQVRSGSLGLIDGGELPRFNTELFGPPALPTYQVTIAVPAGEDYELMLDAFPTESPPCNGQTDFTVPPGELVVYLDCRAEPMSFLPDEPPPSVVYIVGEH